MNEARKLAIAVAMLTMAAVLSLFSMTAFAGTVEGSGASDTPATDASGDDSPVATSAPNAGGSNSDASLVLFAASAGDSKAAQAGVRDSDGEPNIALKLVEGALSGSAT